MTPEKHGGITGSDSPTWQAMRQARRDGFILTLPSTTTEFVTDPVLAEAILRGAIRRARAGESRVEISLTERRK